MSENNGNFDLSGVFQVQQNYLTDLSNSYPDVNNGPVLAKYMLDLQNKVQDVTQSYTDANTSAENVLTEQNQMIDIVENEQDRLLKKKELVDQAEMEERRKVLLTDSNRLRNSEWTKIILVLTICVVIHILLIVIYKYFFSESESESIFSMFALIHIANFAFWTIVAFYLFVNIQSRSQINFNQLNLPPPDTSGLGSTPAKQDFNNLFEDLGLCVANSCCGPQTEYDGTLKMCVDQDYNTNNSPGKTPDASPTVEGFDAPKGITTLTVTPEFTSGTTSQGWESNSTFGYPIPEDQPDEEPQIFDPTTASEEELRQKTDQNVKDSFGGIMGSLKGMALDNAGEQGLNITNDQINSMINDPKMQPAALLGKAPTTTNKCGFTTMESTINGNPIYAPHKDCDFLPKFSLN